MKGKNASAQALTIRLLQRLDALTRGIVHGKAKERLSGNRPAQEQLLLCFSMAGDEPDKYKNFKTLAQTILARQKPEAAVTKTAIWATMTNGEGSPESAGKIVNRIEDRARELKPEEIINLCSGFQKESNRLFWENQIYICFPELPTPDVEDGPVLDCLQAVWDSLPPTEQENAKVTLPIYKAWFGKLSGKEPPASENEKKHLYELLHDAARGKDKDKSKTLEAVFEELGIHKDTYYSYKKNWEKYEERGGGAFPRNRLSRDQLIYLAVFLDMDYYEAVYMLGMAGYALQLDDDEKDAVEYLLDRSGKSRDKALKNLQDKIYFK